MGLGNRIIEKAEEFKVTDKVKILPNKGYGTITKISIEGMIFLGFMDARPYFPFQLEKVDEIPRGTYKKESVKKVSAWHRFWFERPNPLSDEDTCCKEFIALIISYGFTIIMLLTAILALLLFT